MPVAIRLHIGLVDDRTATPDALTLEVVGVVKDLKFTNLRDPAPVQAYYPYLQRGEISVHDLLLAHAS